MKAMKSRFPGNKVFLFSMSWGSILSTKVVEKNPDLIDGVLAWGQIVKELFFCDEVMETLAASKLPAKKLEHLRTVTKENFTLKDLQLVSSSLTKYTNAYQDKTGPKTPILPFVWGLATSPDYSMKALKAPCRLRRPVLSQRLAGMSVSREKIGSMAEFPFCR